MRQLIPPPVRDRVPDLSAAYAYPVGARRWTRANMVASADGAAQSDGVSAGLSGEPDKKLFRVMRALADVVLVGATTVRTEGYGSAAVAREEFQRARAAAGQGPAPAIAVVSASLDLDFGARLFTEAAVPTITVTVEDAPADRLAAARAAGEVIVAGTGRVDLRRAVDLLAASGRGRILCEGGPHLLAGLAAAERLDELCLTLSPVLVAGPAKRIIDGPAIDPKLRLVLHSLLTEDGFLFARYTVAEPDLSSDHDE
ncbi:MAG TPA: pyrimidine reductase family protein [Actinocrinis sp.]|jgi:5-amino-6-(5-phosphoribosylamino)uracil reductase